MNTISNRPFDSSSSTRTQRPVRRRLGLLGCGFLAVLLLALLGGSPAAFAQTSSTSTGPEGSWLYTVTIPGYTTFQGVETYAAGGTYSEADQPSFNPSSVASAGHGAWTSKGRKFVLTYLNLTFDAYGTGMPTGTLKIRQRAKFDKVGNTYSGAGDYTYFDTSGNVVLTGPFTSTATRIQVEAPAAQ